MSRGRTIGGSWWTTSEAMTHDRPETLHDKGAVDRHTSKVTPIAQINAIRDLIDPPPIRPIADQLEAMRRSR